MRSGRSRGPQARARLRALSLTAVSPPASSIRSKKADLVLDTQHGIYHVIAPLGHLQVFLIFGPARVVAEIAPRLRAAVEMYNQRVTANRLYFRALQRKCQWFPKKWSNDVPLIVEPFCPGVKARIQSVLIESCRRRFTTSQVLASHTPVISNGWFVNCRWATKPAEGYLGEVRPDLPAPIP